MLYHYPKSVNQKTKNGIKTGAVPCHELFWYSAPSILRISLLSVMSLGLSFLLRLSFSLKVEQTWQRESKFKECMLKSRQKLYKLHNNHKRCSRTKHSQFPTDSRNNTSKYRRHGIGTGLQFTPLENVDLFDHWDLNTTYTAYKYCLNIRGLLNIQQGSQTKSLCKLVKHP